MGVHASVRGRLINVIARGGGGAFGTESNDMKSESCHPLHTGYLFNFRPLCVCRQTISKHTHKRFAGRVFSELLSR